VLFLLASAVDGEAMALWCRNRLDCDAEWESELDKGLDRSRALRPRLLTIDPMVSQAAVSQGLELVRERTIGHLLVLDRRPVAVRLAQILHEPGASYISRAASPQALASAMNGILLHDRRAFDPSLAPRIRQTRDGYRLDKSGEGALSLLSPRELQVMRLLAQGATVRECAESLQVSESTIDNHKSRLMKKLKIHKTSELTVRAVREGLIDL